MYVDSNHVAKHKRLNNKPTGYLPGILNNQCDLVHIVYVYFLMFG